MQHEIDGTRDPLVGRVYFCCPEQVLSEKLSEVTVQFYQKNITKNRHRRAHSCQIY